MYRQNTAEVLLLIMMKKILVVAAPIVTSFLSLAGELQAQDPGQGLVQRQADAYTRYELLEPSSESFRILYDVTATTSGARFYFNPIRKGSDPTVHAVTDLASGKPLEWKLVSAEAAKAAGLMGSDHDGQFIQVSLARPVPEGGEGRIRIDKTYKDPASYFKQAQDIVFERSLGVQRNAIVLPPGFEVVSCNYPSQVATEEDGRIRVSFMGRGASVPLRLVARPLSAGLKTPRKETGGGGPGQVEVRQAESRPVPASARTEFEVTERAFEDREIVYFLLQPETHSFRLYHDYTEKRPGVDRYLNVVRPGSRAKEPSAANLDTGEELVVETLRGQEITDKGLDIGEPITAATEVVAIWFDPVGERESKRLRIEETYTDAGRYGLDREDLIWDRSFGRPRNTVVLPAGWSMTDSSVPAVVDETEAGEIRLHFQNDRPGVIEVVIRARRR
ncbi:MAG: hypothetical protein WBP36_14625 [Thermoanaerobaculia bacterium]